MCRDRPSRTKERGAVFLLNKQNDGSYTVEGAFTIVIFTALFMMLLSLITLVRLETVIQSALNETAMEVSQYSYGVLKAKSRQDGQSSDLKAHLFEILESENRLFTGSYAGTAICRELFLKNIDVNDVDAWLKHQGVAGGTKGLSFESSSVLGSGSNISAVVTYTVNVNTYGLFDKKLYVRQCANTRAWLPTGISDLLRGRQADANSVWSKDPLIRGRYFVAKIKEENKERAVLSGQGVDLYSKSERKATEVFSLNPFCASYSSPSLSEFNEENINKQLISYAEKLDSDLARAQRLFEMEDGSMSNYGVLDTKEILLIVPNEAEDMPNFSSVMKGVSQTLRSEYNITLTVQYREEAFL